MLSRPVLVSTLALAACGPSYLGPITMEVLPVNPTTEVDLRVIAPVPRAVEAFEIVATNGTDTYTFSPADMNQEPFQFDGTRYTLMFPAANTAKGQTWTFRAIGTIGRGELTGSADAQIRNSPPVGTVTLSPDMPTRADAIVATASFTDADADDVALTYEWFVNNNAVPSISGPEFPPANARRNDKVKVVVRGSDGDDEGAEATAEVTLRNAPPTVSVELSPADPDTRTTLVALASGTDPDGDELTFEYSWEIDGVAISPTTPELAPQLHSRGNVVRVRAVARDGRTISAPDWDEVTILNSAPTMPAVAIDPPAPSVTRALVCALTTPSTDADRDPLTYFFAWRRDGAEWTGSTATTTHAGDTIVAANTREGEAWTCSVSVSDGEIVTGPSAWSAEAIIGPPVAIFTFVDTSSIDLSATALRDFFNANPVTSSDWIFFEVKGGSSGGAWCAERADWYSSNYVSLAGGSSTATSGSWNKWHRSQTGSWTGPVTAGYLNYFGSGCASSAWNWCSEWGLGSRYLGVMPGRSGGESYASTFASGSGWEFTLKTGGARADVCGF
jgi:hypothetical protein